MADCYENGVSVDLFGTSQNFYCLIPLEIGSVEIKASDGNVKSLNISLFFQKALHLVYGKIKVMLIQI